MWKALTYLTAIMAIILPAACTPAAYAADAASYTVVIDPGHGGKDYGCEGDKSNEKTIVLDVARRLGELIAAEHPEVRIIYTRDSDRFIALNERAAIANRAKADLFISIHVNSIDRRSPGRRNVHGASVYTLGLHRTDDNLAVAMRENSVIELESDYTETYQGFDPSSSESYIIFELTQNMDQQKSIELAELMRDNLVKTAGRADKGVLQSGFLVLRATYMPSVLVELDFICNREAERFLSGDEGRAKCARALADAFSVYYRHNRPDTQAGASAAAAPGTAAQSAPEGEVTYAVQFLTSTERLAADSPQLAGASDIDCYEHEGLYKYTSGKFSSLNKAKRHLRTLKKKYPEAFIIKMRDGQRIQ